MRLWLAEYPLPVRAYRPVEQGRLLPNRSRQQVATRSRITPTQVALAWVLHEDHVLPIPKAGRVILVQQNWAAAYLNLLPIDRMELEAAFLRPK